MGLNLNDLFGNQNSKEQQLPVKKEGFDIQNVFGSKFEQTNNISEEQPTFGIDLNKLLQRKQHEVAPEAPVQLVPKFVLNFERLLVK